MSPPRILVCGGRDYSGTPSVGSWLDRMTKSRTIDCIIEGGADGADAAARAWAVQHGVPVLSYPVSPADWKRLGKAAGPIRNARMLREAKPTFVLAFPGDRGTADMVRQARKAGVPVVLVAPTSEETPTR